MGNVVLTLSCDDDTSLFGEEGRGAGMRRGVVVRLQSHSLDLAFISGDVKEEGLPLSKNNSCRLKQ